MGNRHHRIVALGSILAIMGCSVGPARSEFSSGAYEGPKVIFYANTLEKGKRDSGQCPASGAPTAEQVPFPPKEELAPLVITALGWLVDKGTVYIEKYLEERANEYTASSTAKNFLVVPEHADRYLGCIVYVRGKFAEALDQNRPADQAFPDTILNSLGLAKRPQQYAEFWLYFVDLRRTQVTVRPVLFDYAETAAKRTSSDRVKDVAITVSLDTPKAAADSQVSIPAANATVSAAAGPTPGTNAVGSGTVPGTAARDNVAPSNAGRGAVQPRAERRVTPSGPVASAIPPGATAPRTAATATAAPSANSPSASTGGAVKEQKPDKSTVVVSVAFAYPKLPIGARLREPVLRNLNLEAQPLGSQDVNKPMNVTVTVAETENGGDLLLKISNAIKSNQTAIDEKLLQGIKKVLGVDK